MLSTHFAGLVVATVAALVFSTLYYIFLNRQVVAARAASDDHRGYETKMSFNKLLVEIVRTFVLGLVLTYAVLMLNLQTPIQAVILAFWLWIGFPVVLLVGSVIHEHFPARLATIHAIDWLAKLMIFVVIVTLWR